MRDPREIARLERLQIELVEAQIRRALGFGKERRPQDHLNISIGISNHRKALRDDTVYG